MKKKILVTTGSRAEFGLLSNLIQLLFDSEAFDVELLATGTHLSPEFGGTIDEVRKKFEVSVELEMLLSSDTPTGVVKSMGVGLIGIADSLRNSSPDVILLLGDRFEMLVVAQAALVFGIPIVHLHGGELTFGAIDDSIRHAITKLSSLHFVSTDEYRDRVIQMGEEPNRVYNVGALGVENTKKLKLYNRAEIVQKLGVDLKTSTFLLTLHPETNSSVDNRNMALELVRALDNFRDTLIICTYSNADVDGRHINQVFEEYSQLNENFVLRKSLGAQLYLSVMKEADLVIGNSSSGIIEAPSLNRAVVNIGNRQAGRVTAATTLNCDPSYESILEAILASQSESVKENLNQALNPYDGGETAQKIADILCGSDLDSEKVFYDLSVPLKR